MLDASSAAEMAGVGLLLALTSVKTIAAVTTPVWIYRNGARYLDQLGRRDSLADKGPQYWELLDNGGGRIFPFGIRAYRLVRFAHESRGKSIFRRVGGLLARLLHSAFNLAGIVAIGTLTLLAVGIQDTSGTFLRYACLVIGFQFLVMPLMVAVESVFAYTIMGSYGGVYYRPEEFRSQSGRGQFLIEMLWFCFQVAVTYLGDVAIYFFFSAKWHAFGKIHYAMTWHQWLDRLGACAYYVLSNFVTGGDADPRGFIGRSATAIVLVQGVSMIVLILAALTSVPSITKEDIWPGSSSSTGKAAQASAGGRSSVSVQGSPTERRTGFVGYFAIAGMALLAWRFFRRRSRR